MKDADALSRNPVSAPEYIEENTERYAMSNNIMTLFHDINFVFSNNT